MDSKKLEYLDCKFKKIGISLSETQINQFMTYYDMLIEKNKVMNLTAITEFEEVVMKHFVDSVALPKEYIKNDMSLLDLGTGAGFPGIPLKILYPEMSILLLDSLNKRIKFLEEVIQSLGLEKIKAVHGRAEDLAHQDSYREKYDMCVSRAVAKLSSLSEYCIPFVKKKGYFISYKAGEINEEIEESRRAIQILGGSLEEIVEFELPDTEIKRSFVIIQKEMNTNKKYPRSAGKPTKEPLI